MTPKSSLGITITIVGIVGWAFSAGAAESYYNTNGLKKLLAGKRVTLTAGGVIDYAHGGKYNFKSGGQSWTGKWFVRGGRVCVNFPDNNRRCDRYLKDGSSIYFENANGGRYKIRAIR